MPDEPIDLFDPLGDDRQDHWRPANAPAKQLQAVLVAARQLLKASASLDKTTPASDRHGLALLATPTFSLAQGLLRLRNLTEAADRSFWPPADVKALVQCMRRLRAIAGGSPLKTLRDKIAAHADIDYLGSAKQLRPTLTALTVAVGQAATGLLLLLNQEGAFEWMRSPDGSSTVLIGQVTTADGYRPPIAVEVGTADDRSAMLKGLHITTDPRTYAGKVALELVQLYNALASRCEPPEPAITLTEYEPNRPAELPSELRLLEARGPKDAGD